MRDTPRTDAVEYRHCPPQPEAMLKKHEDSYALSRQLERELAVSLENQVKTESDLLQSQDINAFLDTEFRIACKRAEKAEAEVERLKAQLIRAVEIAEVFESELDEYHSVDRNCPDAAWHYPYGWERSEEAKDRLEVLNKEIK